MAAETGGVAPAGRYDHEERLVFLERELARLQEAVDSLAPKSGYHELVNETANRVRSIVWADEARLLKLYEVLTEYDPAAPGEEVSLVETVYGNDGRPLMKYTYFDYTHGAGPLGVMKGFHCKRVT